jgi:hypothetical protein
MSALLEVALASAARSWPVFPLRPGTKVPLIAKAKGGNGVHDATCDADRIRAWWTREPGANIGLAAGPLWWALDLDYAGWEAEQPDGATTFTALVERFGPLPPTVMQLTGGGGWQLLFTGDARVKNGVKFLPGLDTRSAGGYITAPPSIHPDSGRTYAWRRGHGPDDLPIATAPEWLVALVEPVEPPRPTTAEPALPIGDLDHYLVRALERACDAIASAPIGQQADTLDRQAYGIGRLVAGGSIPRGPARAALIHAGSRMANAPRRRPWTHNEIASRVDRAFRQAAHAPRVLEERRC